MLEVKTVKPARGKIIRRPEDGRILKESSERVEWRSYWRRRFRDGDIEIVEQAYEIQEPESINDETQPITEEVGE